MAVTFEEYKTAVKAKCEAERHSAMTGILLDSSRKGLKNLCLSVPIRTSNDKLVLQRIFSIRDPNNLLYEIGKQPLDKLRPLENFIKGKTSNPDNDVVEFLAILVDFQPRPFTNYLRSRPIGTCIVDSDTANKEEDEANAEAESEEKIEKPSESITVVIDDDRSKSADPVISRNQFQKTGFFNKWFYAALIVFTIGGGYGFMTFYKKPQCMTWTGSAYQAMDCDAINTGSITRYDAQLLQNMKKINPTDTTTFFRNGTPIVWYLKHDNKIEFFSSPGLHPETGTTLKAVTKHIVRKYVVDREPIRQP